MLPSEPTPLARNGTRRTGREASAVRPSRCHHLTEWALFLTPLAFSALVYCPITGNYFYADDFLNLYQIGNHSLLQYLITPNGGHLLLTRNAVFYIMHLLFGTQPEYYFWAALLTHLLNVSLLFGLIHVWTRSTRLASFGAALWGSSPLNEGALGWYAVYGHVLVGMFVLMILYQAARIAARDGRPSRSRLFWWYGLALAAATSFGTGLGIAMALPFALWLLLPESGASSRRRPPLVSLVIVLPVLYAALIWAYGLVAGDDTATRPPLAALTSPWESIAIASVRLIAFGLARLLFGFPFPSWATSSVWHGILAVFLAVALLIARSSSGPIRRRLAACALLVVGCYGAIAVGRGALLQSPVFSHLISALSRYHYVGIMFLATICCLCLARIARGMSARAGTIALLAWYAVSVGGYAGFRPVIDHHDRARTHTVKVLRAIQSSIDARPPGQPVYIPNRGFAPLPLRPSLFPGQAAVFTIFYPDNIVDGRRVHFVERNLKLIEATKQGRRTATLFVPPPARAPRR